MKKKGFTLIELICVIVLISLTITVGFKVISNTINTSKNKLYEEQVNRIVKISKTWALNNEKKMPEEKETVYVTLQNLKDEGLLTDKIINPIDDTEMNGCVKITLKSNTAFDYEYMEENICPSENTIYSITYDLDGGTLVEQNPNTYTVNTKTFTLNNPSKLGHSFRGWILATSGNEIPNVDMKVYKGTSGNLKFIAVYETNVYVEIDPNGGTYAGSSEKYGFYVEPYASLELVNPQKESYEFAGWKANVEDITLDGNNVTFGTTSVVLKALWTNCITVNGTNFYTYSNSSTYIDDGNGKYRLKFLNSGTLTLNCPTTVDIFLVGGGSAKGGSGYTQTFKNINLDGGTKYEITVGTGGTTSTINGTDSIFKLNSLTSYIAKAGNGEIGGSGAGTAGYTYPGGRGGSDGSDGYTYQNSKDNKGQGTTTREFGEATGTLYAGGGGGGGGAVYGEDKKNYAGGSGGAGGGGQGGGSNGSCTNGQANTGGGAGTGTRGSVSCSGGSGIVIIRNIKCIGNDKYCYTGKSEYIDDGNGNWRIKLLSSGTLKIYNSTTIDAFLVGGGSSMGGSGYTLTEKAISITGGNEYTIVVGDGGLPGKNGSDTIFYVNNTTSYIAKAGNGETGGSGAGTAGYTYPGGRGGSDGGDGYTYQNSKDNKGQGTTTREFGEATGTLYAGGGGGGGGAVYGEDKKNFAGGSGGAGGGGQGGGSNGSCTNGQANTGGGAGTGTRGAASCYGGSGIVVIRNAR